jgi:peptidoglycan/xylan/chitin deacetylase (PgdA/CDA1 family)
MRPATGIGIVLAMAFTVAFALVGGVETNVRSEPGDFPSEAAYPTERARERVEGQRVDETLARFLADWPRSGDEDRAAMARFFGIFRYGPAVEALRRGAAGSGPASTACLQALAAMGDVASIELFREAIRTGTDCEAIRIAAVALGEWGDHLSYSSLVLSLLTPRCDGAAVVAQVRALQQLRHPYLPELLYLVHQTSATMTARLAAAAALSPRAEGPKRAVVETTLTAAFHSVLAQTAEGTEGQGQNLLLALWGLGRFSSRSCLEALELTTGEFRQAEGDRRNLLARSVLAAAMPCLASARERDPSLVRDLTAAAGMSPGARAQLFEPARRIQLPLADEGLEESPWVDWLLRLATRFSLWDRSGSAAQVASVMERLERLKGTGTGTGRGWSSLAEVAADVHVPKPRFSRLERETPAWDPPEGFGEYRFPTGQPEWWPSWIDLTIDDGPRLGRLSEVVETLDRLGVKATFFFIGGNIARAWTNHPERTNTLLNGMLASGHRIAYHSMAHETRWFSHLQAWTPKQIQADIFLFERIMTYALGRPYEKEFGRLPGGMGRRYQHVRYGLHLGGLKDHVHWDVEKRDWGMGTPKSELRKLARKLVRQKKHTIILLHEYQGLAGQLEAFVEAARAEMEGGQHADPIPGSD